jgi:adenylosuccinate lyase
MLFRLTAMESGREFSGKMFIDATYEGDLMAKAGVSYHVGREANSVYNEQLNGVQVARTIHHQFTKKVDPYVKAGDPSSGLLPGIEKDPGEEFSGDKKVQAYNFRMCTTDVPENRRDWEKPANYDERWFELALRNVEAGDDRISWAPSGMPNRKTDTNNNFAISTDFIGQNWDYPEADYETRAKIWKAHEDWQKGLMWTYAHHPRVPEKIREAFQKFGLAKDEFLDTDNWPRQLYVREARRMISDYVMTERNCRRTEVVEDSVGMGAYNMDSHNIQRFVTAEGFVRNEGDVQVGSRPYPISYRSIRPKAEHCTNLLVPVCLSASHIAYGSIRMEPVFMVTGTKRRHRPDSISNVLAERYATGPMRALWSAEGKVKLERDYWIAVLKGQSDLGLTVEPEVIAAYESVKDQVNLKSIMDRERITRHDVKARIEEFCDLAGHEHIHKGMTSRDLTENVEQLQVFRALQVVRTKVVAALAGFARRAEELREMPLTARTHNVAAQVTRLGKRMAMFGEELLQAFESLETLLGTYPARGLKGAVGTRLDQITLFGGDAEKASQLDSRILQHLGMPRSWGAVGQVYPRSLDFRAVSVLVDLASGPSSFAKTLRLMAGHESGSEGFAKGQVGSSAMPHKMNSRSCERINGLHVVLKGYLAMASGLAGDQWNEGDVSCSVVRRVMLPDAFLAMDGLLETLLTVLNQMSIFEAVVELELRRYLPFLITTTGAHGIGQKRCGPRGCSRSDQRARRRCFFPRCGGAVFFSPHSPGQGGDLRGEACRAAL